ncbi:hypothetical protein [[Clostridium] polysaccharolyticum]|uniref:Uncharacterized protein n=1 Tax=[Clostridium] polysaccharolyticum TaxID=29364 RepID=A0A1I0BWV4_9FIRM|nr:hypothetical protein [[Clostridium] polysaccharolyticum]SET11628.1 hypothetical protein SAMN04487772_108129 [[Clostridium] polysaccharolyticum]
MKKLVKKVDKKKKLVAFYANESCNTWAYCANNSGNCVSGCS